MKQRHTYHLVAPSYWPVFGGFSALVLVTGGARYLHSYDSGLVLWIGFFLVTIVMVGWWRDVIKESNEGDHSVPVLVGLRYGVLLFILSEVLLFAAFFWAFFHSSLSPTVEIGSIWPPKGIVTINPWDIPLLNTLILLSSGVSVTWAHHAIIQGNRKDATISLIITVILAGIFTAFQAYEYIEAPFSIADGIYGSTFYLATGFHGAHVIIGTIFLTVCLVRLLMNHFTKEVHFGFEAAAWYWHFVDVVWLFLFVSIYWWGSV